MKFDSKDLLQKAEELLAENKDCLDKRDSEEPIVTGKVLEKGSYDEEKELLDGDGNLEKKESPKTTENLKKFNIPNLGYKREIHYKKPTWYKFLCAGLAIIGLIIIISLLMPYIPPR